MCISTRTTNSTLQSNNFNNNRIHELYITSYYGDPRSKNNPKKGCQLNIDTAYYKNIAQIALVRLTILASQIKLHITAA